MKLFLDNIVYAKDKNGGISNYWYEWSKYLLSKPDEVYFNDEHGVEHNFHRALLTIDPGHLITNPKSILPSIISRMSSTDGKDPRLDGHLLYHSSYYRPLKNHRDFVEVTTVHDFIHDYYFPRIKRTLHNSLKYPALQRSKGIICISKSTYDDLQKFCPPKKNQKVEVIYNGVNDDYCRLEDSRKTAATTYIDELSLTKPYIIYIGSRANYKNFDFTVALMNRLPGYQFVIIGSELSEKEKAKFTRECLAGTVVISNITNENLNIIYNFAHALVYPSYYEGFGIPVIEAMRAGCPVLAINTSSIAEIGGSAALLSDSLDTDFFISEIEKLKDHGYRDDVAGKGFEISQKYSWQKCCDETYDFYQQIY